MKNEEKKNLTRKKNCKIYKIYNIENVVCCMLPLDDEK